MKTTVGRTYRFRATHSLPGFPEPWCFPHQHDYTVEVVAEGGTPTDTLDSAWRPLEDGRALFEGLSARDLPSTVEHLATAVLLEIPEAIAATVWEDKQRWGKAER